MIDFYQEVLFVIMVKEWVISLCKGCFVINIIATQIIIDGTAEIKIISQGF